jgi:non-specific serine/threonine protein kinase
LEALRGIDAQAFPDKCLYIANALMDLGRALFYQGDIAAAHDRMEEGITLLRQDHMPPGTLAAQLLESGLVILEQGDCLLARSRFEESMKIAWKRAEYAVTLPALECFACLACREEQFMRAARLFAVTERIRQETGVVVRPSRHVLYDREVAAVRQALGGAAFAAAWTEGRNLTLEQAVEYALEQTPERQG